MTSAAIRGRGYFPMGLALTGPAPARHLSEGRQDEGLGGCSLRCAPLHYYGTASHLSEPPTDEDSIRKEWGEGTSTKVDSQTHPLKIRPLPPPGLSSPPPRALSVHSALHPPLSCVRLSPLLHPFFHSCNIGGIHKRRA